jgi:predicted double-glycine peptidase
MKKYLASILFVAALLALIIGRAFIDTTHPDAYENQGFEFIAQPDNITCGPTSTTMLLKYYGKDVTIAQVEKETRTKWFHWKGEDIGMTAPEYVEIALRRFGVPAKMQRGSFNNLKHYVSQGRPVIVNVRSGQTTWHYVVVIGYTNDQVILADPGDGARITISAENFLGCWSFQTDMDGTVCGHSDPLWGRVDPLKDLLWAGEVYPYTMIVPERKK